MTSEFQYTNDWFDSNRAVWDKLIPMIKPRKILEIGSYEGRSTCWLIDKCTQYHPIEIHCIDSWEGGIEHERSAMNDVESRFDNNISVATKNAKNKVVLHKHKSLSNIALANLITNKMTESFDLIYLDGSHQAPDVLYDAVVSFHLLRVGGVMIFDDYLWHMEEVGKQDLFNMPKLAIDSFLNIFQRKMSLFREFPACQLYGLKISS